MQLWPEFCSRIVAMCSAWKRRSASVQAPGTTMIGETPPSSAVIGFFSFGRFSRLRRAVARGPGPVDGPHTIASKVGAAPVMCTCAMPGWPVRYSPTSGPPRTIRTKPGSMSGASARSNTGGERIVGGVELQQRDAVVRQQFVQHVEHRDRADVAGAEHEPDAAGVGRRELREPGGAARLVVGDAGLEPHLAGEARQQQAVDRAEREDVGAHAPAGRGIRLHARQRALALGELEQRRAVEIQRRDDPVRPGEPVLAAQRMPGAGCPSTWRRRRPTPRRRPRPKRAGAP